MQPKQKWMKRFMFLIPLIIVWLNILSFENLRFKMIECKRQSFYYKKYISKKDKENGIFFTLNKHSLMILRKEVQITERNWEIINYCLQDFMKDTEINTCYIMSEHSCMFDISPSSKCMWKHGNDITLFQFWEYMLYYINWIKSKNLTVDLCTHKLNFCLILMT